MTERNYKEQMVADRRWLHAHPEDGWNEFETTYFIVKRLEGQEVPFQRNKRKALLERLFG